MNNKIYSFLLSIIVIFLSIDYFPKETLAEEMNIIQKSDGVVVSNPKTPVPKNGLKMRFVFKEELSIGEVEGDENYMFGQSIAFNTDEDGNFYVTDSDAHRILKYDPEGKYLLTIGREGQGPGEFRSLSGAKFDKDNNFYVTDIINRRISFFNKGGKFLRQIQIPGRYLDLYINLKGYIVANRWNMSQDLKHMKQTSIFGLFDDKFNLISELYKDEIKTPLPTGRDESSLVQYVANSISVMAFRPQGRLMLGNNDLIYLGYPRKYVIDVYSSTGKLVKRIRREYDPLTISTKDKKTFIKFAREQFHSENLPEGLVKEALKKIKYPKYKPAYQSFTLMENGWLAVIVDSVEDEYTLFDIFDQEGRYIAHFKTLVPDEGMLYALFFYKNCKAYAVVTENDYKFVKRYNFEIQEYKDNRWVRKK